LYRNTLSAPLPASVQGDLLRELSRDYPSLTQIPNGVLFADATKGRALIIDQTRIEVSENGAHVSTNALEQMQADLHKTVPLIDIAPPYRVRIEGTGTIQALEGLDPAAVLRNYAPPNPAWDSVGGHCTHSCVRFLFTGDDGTQRDVHVEPLFAQPDKFYVMAVSMNAPTGVPSLERAMRVAQDEVGLIERLSDRIVSDIAEPTRTT